ncbi:MAG: hypothetical protein ACRBBQ_12565 [Cognatishimia sp.]
MHFDDHSTTEQIRDLNLATVSDHKGHARRAQHPKHHGVVKAILIIANVPKVCRKGVFSKEGQYECLIRFSNGRRFDDRKADAHGMAIKVLNADGGGNVQDFVLVDHETFFSGDLKTYERINQGLLGRPRWRSLLALLPLLFDWSMIKRMISFASKQPNSPIAASYFSTTPYRLGPDLAVKWVAEPSGQTSAPEVTEHDGLSKALRHALKAGPVIYRFGADIQIDPTTQPIEDPSVAWSSQPKARREWFGELKLLPIEAEHDEPDLHPGSALAENLVFSPWHHLPDHEPLGALNAARRSVYQASAEKRHDVNCVTPKADEGAPKDYATQHLEARLTARGKGVGAACLALLLVTAALAAEAHRFLTKPGPPRTFDDPVTEFKYGSIGAEWSGFPYAVWRELPTIFPELLPEGWSGLGFIEEAGHDVPVGISVRRLGVDRVGFNCATCHTSEVTVDNRSITLMGAPASQLDLQAYIDVLTTAVMDDRLSAEAIIESAEQNNRPLTWPNRLLMEHIIVPAIKDQGADLGSSLAWMQVKPRHGPGRTDAGNTWRARWNLEPEADQRVGTVDFPSVWNQRIRADGWFHWDGNNSSLTERNYSAALAGGAMEWRLQRYLINAQSDWLMDLPAPPFPGDRDEALYTQGRMIYQAEGCGTCHDVTGAAYGAVTSSDELGTDRERTDMFDANFVAQFSNVGAGYSWQFSSYQATDGYANMPLDGIWARGPYLHNGSVPTLVALLSPPEERPETFYRGCDEIDLIDVGYNCADGFEFDTSLIGNSNLGHDYGTALASDETRALIEYLKFIE